jgi:hypothetical protein
MRCAPAVLDNGYKEIVAALPDYFRAGVRMIFLKSPCLSSAAINPGLITCTSPG